MTSFWLPLTIALLLATAPRVGAQVSCADPDNLCTGNPCVIETITVATPCEVDFGGRTLEIAGLVTVPNGGVLSFSAGPIRLLGRIDGRNAGTGAAVTLVSTGDLDVEGKIDVDGGAGGGSVDLSAGFLMVTAKIRASSKLGPGGSVTLDAPNVRLRKTIDVRGTTGGTITAQGGYVEVGPLDARGSAGSGGSVMMSGSMATFSKSVDVRGKGGNGGTVAITTGFLNVGTDAKVLASGSVNGGSIAFGSALVWGKLFARGKTGNGGALLVSAPDPVPDGTVSILRAKGDFRGALAGGLVQVDADILGLIGSQITVAGGASPGAFRLHTSGTIGSEVSSKLDAGDGGVIEVLAPNADLIVGGKFQTGGSGCVGVSAGGTLDTSGLASDVPLSASCP